MNNSVFVHIVTYDSADASVRCIESVLSQIDVTLEQVFVTDNASTNSLPEMLTARFGSKIGIERNKHNLGFCGAHNQGVKRFLDSQAKYLLILNPDVRLESTTLSELINAQKRWPNTGLTTPLLLRADSDLNPLAPAIIDACGMELSASLRHLDRGSGQKFANQFEREELVFGGSGACLLIERACVEALILTGERCDDLKAVVEPQLLNNQESRLQLFDEAFFAYREDADLCWRAGILGWSCVYVPRAKAYHTRAVLPERRAQLTNSINQMGVRNRFLLQLNNFMPFSSIQKLLIGALLRNLVVLFAVIFIERTSITALRQVLKLWPRALERRRILLARTSALS